MKKIFGMLSLAAVLFAMVGFISCKGNNEAGDKGNIVGKWKYVAKSEDGSNWIQYDGNRALEFQDNGKLNLYNNYVNEYGDIDSYEWSLKGTTLTTSRIGLENSTFDQDIRSLTGDEMIIAGPDGSLQKFKRLSDNTTLLGED